MRKLYDVNTTVHPLNQLSTMQQPRNPFENDDDGAFRRPGLSSRGLGESSQAISADDAIRETDSDAAGSRL